MVKDPGDGELCVTSEPQGLSSLLKETKAAYQESLIARADLRKQLMANIDAAKTAVAAESREFNPRPGEVARLSLAWDEYGQPVSEAARPTVPRDLAEASASWKQAISTCEVILQGFNEQHATWQSARKKLFKKKTPEPRLPGSFHAALETLRSILDTTGSLREARVGQLEGETIPSLRASFDAEAQERERALERIMRSNLAALQMGVDLLGVSGEPWIDRLTKPSLISNGQTAAARLGSIRSGLPKPFDMSVPCVISFPSKHSLALESSLSSREPALALMRSLVMRVLMDFPPGRVQFSFLDPTAMGQTFAEFVHLGDFDDRLIDTGVKTSSTAIERCLEQQVTHLETVISKYLRGQFANIHDYNRHAGDMAEPYRVIVVADFPQQFSERACQYLLSLVENGSRCGIFVLVMYSRDEEAPRGLPFERLLQSMDVVRFRGKVAEVVLHGDSDVIEFDPDECPPIAFDTRSRPATPAAEFIEALGRTARKSATAVISLENFLPVVNRNRAGALPEFQSDAQPLSLEPDTWWAATTADMAVAPVGRSGAQGVASLYFSSTMVAGGAIVVGLPRSGKTTALHSMILTMAMLYSPEELELYLIDAKHGVEFKAYERLPHARMVSIHSEREFSLAVLKSIQSKIRERAELIKRQGGGLSNITEYRRVTGASLPRIVVFVDEFHELFEEADSVGLEAFAAFSDIVRMGPFSGVHVVVASQTLSSMPAMDRQTLMLLPQRVAFMCNEYDAEIVMGETNKAARMLSKTGEGLFNPSRGEESRNQPFQGLYVEPGQRARVLGALRDKADRFGFGREPRVFDGDSTAERPKPPGVPVAGGRFSVPVGEPFTLDASQSVTLPRTRGGNVMVLGDIDDDTRDYSARGVVHSILLAASRQGASVTVVDFVGDEEVDGLTVLEVAEATGARYQRAAGLRAALQQVASSISDRSERADYKAPTEILLLFGLQRALSLSPYAAYSDGDQDPPSVAQLLWAVITEGPEVGVHTIVDADRALSVQSRLGVDLMGEFSLRVAGSGAEMKDRAVATGAYGDVPPLRTGQLLIGDLLKGTTTRARGYDILRQERTTAEIGVENV